MGVKGLWSYVEHHSIQYAFPNKNARADCYAANPRHLLVDMNAVLHIAYDPTRPTTAATLRAVTAKMDELLTRVRARDTLVLVYDGVAPIAKLKTQKERRNSLSVHPPRPATAVASSKGSGNSSIRVSPWYTCDPVLGEVPLHREEILCGAEFVLACEEYITTYLQQRKAHYSWAKLIVSGCCEPGEGEVKMSALLRRLWAETVADGSYSQDDVVTMVGNDSDLILVAMVAVPYSYYTLIDPFDLSLTSLWELMNHWSQAVPNPPLPAELLPSYRIDFVFLMLLSGDDYYEGIGGDSIALWRRYRHLRVNEGYFRRALISGGHLELDVEFLRAVLARSGSMATQLLRVPRNKRKTTKALLRGGGGCGGGGAKEGTQLLAAALWSLRSYVFGRCPDYGFFPHREGPPSVGSLRAAAHVRGLSRKIGCGIAEGAANAETADAGKVEEVTSPVGPVFAPLEQCIAVLGIRGRFSVELSRAIRVSTQDDGHRLTTSTSIGLLTENVRNIMTSVDTARLTEAERRLSHCHSAGAEDEDVGAFMRLAAILSRKAAPAAFEGEKRLNQSDEVQQGRTE
ncbi:XRN 5'-3' exonuclease N-inus [Leishmania donovani]|uniref:XRN_5'-3'_exonuclease_N-inus n=1 Tax=Leishmania donovani TaxID=5661 RepID=A0A6J8FEZ6_LEIDO|nr:XRN 5'-3' exonuclease N-inus [Leishmania donovani]VDZ45822.1 XRN_5'-3'_exonuclease_N-inus [Leishmania donovani]